jgi:hypothetical protein
MDDDDWDDLENDDDDDDEEFENPNEAKTEMMTHVENFRNYLKSIRGGGVPSVEMFDDVMVRDAGRDRRCVRQGIGTNRHDITDIGQRHLL